MIEKDSLIKLLTYLGGIPFIFLTSLKLFGVYSIFNIPINILFIFYSCIILSFIAGINFGYALFTNHIFSTLLIGSNIIALLSFLSLLLDFNIALTIIFLCYLLVLYIDFLAQDKKIIESWYFNLRKNISIIVLINIILFLIL